MAKKKQDLSPEERLAAALVPEKEWPYALPDGWKWVYLGEITTIVGGGTPSSRCREYYDDQGHLSVMWQSRRMIFVPIRDLRAFSHLFTLSLNTYIGFSREIKPYYSNTRAEQHF